MIVRFANKIVLELFEEDLKRCVAKYKFAKFVVEKYRFRIGQLIDAPDFQTLKQIKSLNLEKLKDDRSGQYSIRVDNKFRICFHRINKSELTIEILELTDYHLSI